MSAAQFQSGPSNNATSSSLGKGSGEMILIQFKRDFGPYKAGDRAALPVELADRLAGHQVAIAALGRSANPAAPL
jgi:hypothetical protein